MEEAQEFGNEVLGLRHLENRLSLSEQRTLAVPEATETAEPVDQIVNEGWQLGSAGKGRLLMPKRLLPQCFPWLETNVQVEPFGGGALTSSH